MKSYKIKIHTPDTGYEPFPVSIINRSTYEATTFNPALGKPATISYKLTKAGTIRLRIARRDAPELVLRTLMDWTDQPFGEHKIEWDGRDASGNIIDNKRVLIIFDSKDQAFGGKHQEHDGQACSDPRLLIETDQRPEGVKGKLDIRTSFSEGPDNIRWSAGCEVRYFIDYILITKEIFREIPERFYLPVDTSKLANGEHLVTVNISDFNDHTGTAGIKITVNN
ncbi:MAG: hypothetical protein C4526_10810 [Nitrospiraceae bacterium]|nr:MAG: hypothetical protein C4526_10810 [Nitrospiraceae bacterium]